MKASYATRGATSCKGADDGAGEDSLPLWQGRTSPPSWGAVMVWEGGRERSQVLVRRSPFCWWEAVTISDPEKKKRLVGSASAGQKHELLAQEAGVGYKNGKCNQIRLRIHECDRKYVRMICHGAHPFVDFIVYPFCGTYSTMQGPEEGHPPD